MEFFGWTELWVVVAILVSPLLGLFISGGGE